MLHMHHRAGPPPDTPATLGRFPALRPLEIGLPFGIGPFHGAGTTVWLTFPTGRGTKR